MSKSKQARACKRCLIHRMAEYIAEEYGKDPLSELVLRAMPLLKDELKLKGEASGKLS